MAYCVFSIQPQTEKGVPHTVRFVLVAENGVEMEYLSALKISAGGTGDGDRLVIERKMDIDQIGSYIGIDQKGIYIEKMLLLDSICAYFMGMIHFGPLCVGDYRYGIPGESQETFQRKKKLQKSVQFLSAMKMRQDEKKYREMITTVEPWLEHK